MTAEERPVPPDAEPEPASAADPVIATRALLGIVARSLDGALDRVTLPQFRILVVLSSRGALRAGLLAGEIGTSPSTLTRAVDRLVRDGWVRRRVNPASRRETQVIPTERALELVREVTERRRRALAQVLATLSTEDRDAVQHGFALFATAAGEPPDRDVLTLGL